VTSDRAAHWSQVTSSIPLPRHYNSCQMIANDTNAASAVVTMMYNAGSASGSAAEFATFDGGKSWREERPQDNGTASQFAATQPAVYETGDFYSGGVYSGNTGTRHLFAAPLVTFAAMSTWQRVDTTLPAHVERFWVNPATGALLVFAYDDSKQ